MTLDKALERILDFKKSDMNKHGKRIAKKHREQFTAGVDRMGKFFKAYSPSYAKKKRAGQVRKDQISKQVYPVNLTLTGKMSKSFGFIKSYSTKGEAFFNGEIGFDYGITDGKQAQRMMDLADGKFGKKTIRSKKRIVAADQRLGPKVEFALAEMFVKQIVNNLNRLTSRTKTVINI